MTNHSPPYFNKTGENYATEMSVHPDCSESKCGWLGEEEDGWSAPAGLPPSWLLLTFGGVLAATDHWPRRGTFHQSRSSDGTPYSCVQDWQNTELKKTQGTLT